MLVMNILTLQSGYDEDIFLTQVPQYFYCIICHMVLRKPKQILVCGHKFCSTCFERFREFSLKTNAPLVCPVDRKGINEDDVAPDVGIDREIGNLKVACHEKINGCKWQGDLRDMINHVETCQKAKSISNEETSQRLEKSIEQIEKHMLEKDEEIALLKGNYLDLRSELTSFKINYDELKNENDNIRKELHEIRKGNIEFQEEQKSLVIKLEELEESCLSEDMISEYLKSVHYQAPNLIQNDCPTVPDTVEHLTSNANELQPFFDIDIGGVREGRMYFKLYTDVAPKTCEKFVDLCNNKYGFGYKGIRFDAVYRDCCKAGTYLRSDLGYQIPNVSTEMLIIPKENRTTGTRKGHLAMEGCDGEHTKSTIFIYFVPNDNGSVIFGEVTEDTWHVLEKLKQVGGRRPLVYIFNCGVEHG